MNKILELVDIHHSYAQGQSPVEVLRGISLSLKPSQVTCLVGPSGCGKSTLLHIAGLLERPKSGRVYINGHDTSEMKDKDLSLLRRSALGFVFQFHHLLAEFTALENVSMPLIVAGQSKKTAQHKAQDMLNQVGLSARLSHRPGELSGGEQQRVAIARALINNPSILLADEPTGNLDPATGADIFQLIQSFVKETATTALIVTHNLDLAKKADRTLKLGQGVI